MRVLAVDAAAQAAGLAGLTLKAARSRVPHLCAVPFDAEADRRVLRRLLTLCRRFTPSLADPSPNELMLDVSGVAALFGGETGLLLAVQALFAAEGMTVQPGLADTPGLARALARFGEHRVAPSGTGEAALAALPLDALSLSYDDTSDLHGLGFRRVGEVMARPRVLLAEMLQGRLGQRLDEMLGHRACPLTVRLEPVRIVAVKSLMVPISGAPAILHEVRRMAERIEDQLARRGLGARALRLTLHVAGGMERRMDIGVRQSLTGAAAITALFARRFAGLAGDASEDEEFDELCLKATLTEPLAPRTADLFDDRDVRFDDFVEGLAARGRATVEVIRTDTRTVVPEHEARFAPVGALPIGDGPPGPLPVWGDTILRPLRLFDPPQVIEVLAGVPDDPPAVLVWRRISRRILKAEGPERLAADCGPMRTRDYYRVEDSEGRRYWVFRDGLFGGAVAPRWYLHGLFA